MITILFKPTECEIMAIKTALQFLHETSPFKPRNSEAFNGITVYFNNESEIFIFGKVVGAVESKTHNTIIDLSKTIITNKNGK